MTQEHYNLKSGRTIQVLHHNGTYWTILFDLAGLQPTVLEVYPFTYLHEASAKATEILRGQARNYTSKPYEEQVVSKILRLEPRD